MLSGKHSAGCKDVFSSGSSHGCGKSLVVQTSLEVFNNYTRRRFIRESRNFMKTYTGQALREMYLNFFKERGHKVIPSASLIPENDPTVLFTTAGMHPLVPYLLGEKHPAGKRLTDVQKCVRTGDIDDVGDERHCTFFEMLGSWSLGMREYQTT